MWCVDVFSVFVARRNSDKGVEIAYLGTRTGLSRINLFVVPDELTNEYVCYLVVYQT